MHNSFKYDAWTTKVIYQIYPRSFKDTNKDGIGDINGIVEKLDYLGGKKDSLGIDAIWASPVYKSPMKDFGYDVSDYCDIDPMFGTLKDFDRLVREAHKRNIKIIMDYIPNHTSSLHPWFVESRSSKNNPKRDWYIWRDPKPDCSPPNNWVSVFGGSMWEFDKKSKQYYLHSFLKEQPDLNWRNKKVKEAMLDVLRFWLRRGVDGFRIDAFNHIFKDKRFLDEPRNQLYVEGKSEPFEKLRHIYTKDQPELESMVKTFSSVLLEFGRKFMITETYAGIETLIRLYKAGSNLHAPYNFHFIQLPWDAQKYREFISDYDAKVGPNYSPTYVLGNHDKSRVASRIGLRGAKVAALLQLTLRGIPTIYYGEEIGMHDVVIPSDKIQDPFEKNAPGIGVGRDPERTPMQWDRGKNAGFSDFLPWLQVGKDYKKVNVESEKNDQASILNFYRNLLRHRKKSKPLLFGIYKSIESNSRNVFAFLRSYKKERLLVVLNFANDKCNISLPFKKGYIVLNTHLDKGKLEVNLKNLSLRGHEGLLLSIRE